MAMVTGGFLPAELRGTKNFAQMHVADWCLFQRMILLATCQALYRNCVLFGC